MFNGVFPKAGGGGQTAGQSRARVQLNGDPGVIRTRDLEFRKLLLYPSELRGHSVSKSIQEDARHIGILPS